MLDATFIKAIAEQAIQAAHPQLEEIDETTSYAARQPSGQIEMISGKPARRDHNAKDLETIIAFAGRFIGSSIWYSRDKIVCLTDDDDRRDSVSVSMIHSDQIKLLRELEAGKPLVDQRKLLFMMRTVFTPNAFPSAPKLIDSLRQVKWEAGSKVEGSIQRGKSSIGKEAAAAATFMDAVPEQVTLCVPLFHNSFAFKSYDVICALEIHEAENKFQLFPLPGEVESAFASAEADISELLRDLLGADAKTPVYYGAP